jgi:hypothetical protein
VAVVRPISIDALSEERMYCWSCGTRCADEARYCTACGGRLIPDGGRAPDPVADASATDGAPNGRERGTSGRLEAPARPVLRPARAPFSGGRVPVLLRGCPSCGYRGEGIPYFRRAGNLALLAAATLFTYGVGGVVYWLLKRSDRVCPSCGLGWERSRPLGEGAHAELAWGEEATGSRGDHALVPSGVHGVRGPAKGHAPVPLPSGGGVRRFSGVVLGLVGLLLLGIGVVQLTPEAAVVGGIIGLSGAMTFAWGWRSLQARRQAVLQRMQRDVIRIARARGGSLTATDVAAEMDLTLPAAERVLLSLDDGFRVTSDVTEEGILLFDFRELRLGQGEE